MTLSPIRRSILKALFTCLCALVLVSSVMIFSASVTDAEAEPAERAATVASRDAHGLEDDRSRRARTEARSRRAAVAAKARTLASARARAVARTPQAIICRVFGQHCQAALAVARCESGYRTDARNGQYLGLFQMGDWARTNYGHGTTARVQVRAAYRLFTDTGRTWQPWSCKP